MADRKVPLRSTQPKRYIPVRNSTAATRPVPSSRIPRPTFSRSLAGSSSRQPDSRPQPQSAPPPEPQPTPQEPPAAEVHPFQRQTPAPFDVDLIIPTRQARPPSVSSTRRQPQPPTLPPDLQTVQTTASGNPLAQPNYQLDWLPEDDQWLNRELALAYTAEAVEAMKGHQLRSAKQRVAEGVRENEVLFEMFEAGVPFDVIDRFLEEKKGYEEDEAEQRETEYFEKLEQMIADEADDIDLALTLSRLDLEKYPRREGVPTMDFSQDTRARRQKQKFQRGLRSVRRGIEAMTVLAEEDEPEEVEPELAAAMMYTEEYGPGMTNAPNDMFAFLFSNQPEETDEQPSEAGPLVAQEGRELAATGPRDIAEQKSWRMHREAEAPLQQVHSPSRLSPAAVTAPPVAAPSVAPFLPPRAPHLRRRMTEYPGKEVTKRFNVVQMCGSRQPFWFRGYFEAFPHTIGRIAISESPSVTLQTAWYLMRPETFKMNRRIIVPAL